MKARSIVRRVLPALVAVAFVVLSLAIASPAMAAPATMDGINITATSHGHSFTEAAGSFITTDSVVTTSAVASWVATITKTVNVPKREASLKINRKTKKLSFLCAHTGYNVNAATALAQIIAELRNEVSTGASGTVALTTTITKPKVTSFGMRILVVQSQFKVKLYNNGTLLKQYKCAVGQRRYPTPNGTFHIGKKNPHPSWHNGYASWSRNMPAYIGPGINNPLGTRALYVYTGSKNGRGHDTGVRLHGIPASENSSLGHRASHGCIRMRRSSIENLYDHYKPKVGTIVYIIK
jgi:lipoprotein-anchoring transpeptidase ErfK/SrfK